MNMAYINIQKYTSHTEYQFPSVNFAVKKESWKLFLLYGFIFSSACISAWKKCCTKWQHHFFQQNARFFKSSSTFASEKWWQNGNINFFFNRDINTNESTWIWIFFSELFYLKIFKISKMQNLFLKKNAGQIIISKNVRKVTNQLLHRVQKERLINLINEEFLHFLLIYSFVYLGVLFFLKLNCLYFRLYIGYVQVERNSKT